MRTTLVSLVFLLVFLIGVPLISVSTVSASGWSGWDSIDTIYYDPAQDDPINHYLEQAAIDLRNNFQELAKDLTINTDSKPSSGSIYLEVDPDHPALINRGNEAFRLYTDNSGVYITGKTALAVRHGAYELLERIGFRWFFKNPIWYIIPDNLVELGNLDFVTEPDFTDRLFVWLPYSMDGEDATANWSKFNRLPGEIIGTGHSYATWVPTATYYADHPGWYTGSAPSTPWQLEPAGNNDLISLLVSKIDASLSANVSGYFGYLDEIKLAGNSLSPNDGGGWPPNYSGSANVSDCVFTLANEVAANLTTPNAYVGCLSYAWHPNVPTFSLESNVYAMITDGYNFSDTETEYDRIVGFNEQGAKTAVYKYLDWIYNYDRGGNLTSWDYLTDIKEWHEYGNVTGFDSPVYDGWGGRGLLNYYLAKLMWDTDTEVDETIEDFVDKCFAGAKTEMQQYYDDMYDSPSNRNSYTLKQLFTDLDAAVDAAGSDETVLERIYWVSYWTRFVWLYHNIGISNLTDEELEDFYTFICQTRYLYVVSYPNVKGALEDELEDRGYSAEEIAALEDFTEPTEEQALGWIEDGLDYFNGLSASETIKTYNPRLLDLTALGDNVTADVDPLYTVGAPIMIPCDASENVTVQVKGHGTLKWFTDDGFYLDRQEIDSTDEYTSVNFTSMGAGNYFLYPTLTTAYGQTGFYGRIKVLGRAASIVASDYELFSPDRGDISAPDILNGTQECYFYVPSGTEIFAFGAPYIYSEGTLTNPLDNEYDFEYEVNGEWLYIEDPEPGLWHLSYHFMGSHDFFYLKGIPPLVWYDPEHLLVPVPGSNSPPLASNQNMTTDEDTPVNITLTASDPDGDSLTYEIVTNPSNGTLSGISPALTYTPNPDFSGSDSFTFTASDGTATSNSATVIITVNPVADAPPPPPKGGGGMPPPSNSPPLAGPQAITTDEDTSVEVTLSASDADDDSLTYEIVTSPSNGTLSGNLPVVTYTPNPDFNGSDSFSFTASDSNATSSPATVTITVNPVDDAPPESTPPPDEDGLAPPPNSPPLASPQAITTDEDTSVEVTLIASDADGDPLTYEIITNPANGTLSGTPPDVTYIPNPGFSGSDSFTFVASDGTVTSSPVTININVNGVADQIISLEASNSAPLANFQTIDTTENSPVEIILNAEDPNGDSLTFVIVTNPSNGTLSGAPPVLTYTPNPNFIGMDSFTFTASDGISISNTATVLINISKEKQGLIMPFVADWKIGNFPIIFIVPSVIVMLPLVVFGYQYVRRNHRYTKPQLRPLSSSSNVLNSRKD